MLAQPMIPMRNVYGEASIERAAIDASRAGINLIACGCGASLSLFSTRNKCGFERLGPKAGPASVLQTASYTTLEQKTPAQQAVVHHCSKEY